MKRKIAESVAQEVQWRTFVPTVGDLVAAAYETLDDTAKVVQVLSFEGLQRQIHRKLVFR